MGLNYDFYKNPSPKDRPRKKRLHARVVPSGTIDTDAIANMIHETSTMSTGDVKGVLTALTELMKRELSDGYRIHLEGLGYFQLTLSCPPVRTPKEIRAESIRAKSVVYRADAKMKKHFKAIRCTRVREKYHSQEYSDIEIDGILTTHFMDNEYITCQQFRRMCGFTTSTAYRRFKQLITANKLRRSELQRSLYEPVKGNYRR